MPKNLAQAVRRFTAELGQDQPETWGFAEEQQLLDHYLDLRHNTSMTDSRKRAQGTQRAVADGLASDQRGSFVV